MKWLEARVNYTAEEMEIARDLIAEVFYDLGVQGVELGEPMAKHALDYYSDDKLLFQQDYYVTGYFPKNNYIDSKTRYFEEKLKETAALNNIIYEVSYLEVDEADWADSWKKYFNPEKITDRVVVKPTWKEYEKSGNEVIIEIDPGMAFGTGTHPTTWLCMNMIDKYIREGVNVLDVGTGSGILMTTALKLGAGYAVGTDIDDVAVDVAAGNLKLNNLPESMWDIRLGNLVDVLGESKYEMIVANILAEIIVILLDDIIKFMNKDSIFIGSGIIKEKTGIVTAKMAEVGLSIVEIAEKDDWVSIIGRLE